MGGKAILALFGILLVTISGCSLFVAQPPTGDGKVCVDKAKLSAVLTTLNISVEDLAADSNATVPPTGAVIETPTGNRTEPEQPTGEKPVEEIPVVANASVRYFTEGDLVKLSPKATDADGDKITFKYSEPLNAKGEWQTKAGDAGEYLVTVTASDGKSEATKQVKIVVTGKNSPPVIKQPEDITVAAGDLVTLAPQVSDPDGDDVKISYKGFMNESTYVTAESDIGEHFVTVVASDGKSESTAIFKVTVTQKNRAPVIDKLDSITVKEGELVKVVAQATDADGDKITLTYSEPLDAKGEWQTKAGDAGTYLVTVTASDGTLEAKQTLTVIVESKNSPPVITLDDVTVVVNEAATGEVKLAPTVVDPDGDKVDITYSGWMTSATKEVTSADAGAHQVTVTATDGKSEAVKVITVTVTANAPPVFDFG
jgi:VCBS repeat-containing protein